MINSSLTGLVLTGGGARGAYQAGALSAIYEICQELGLENPFPVISGSSAGAINGSFMAAYAHSPYEGVKQLNQLWANITEQDVYKTGALNLSKIGLQWLGQLSLGGLKEKRKVASLLDTSPLRALIERSISFDQINKNIKQEKLHGVSVSAINYNSGTSSVFFQGDHSIQDWQRTKRSGERQVLTAAHVLASASIPILFPPVKLGECYFGDGSLRNYTPLSPAIKLGAKKIVVVAVRKKDPGNIPIATDSPSVARILSVMLNSVLLDSVDLDYERLARINETLSLLPPEKNPGLSPVDVFFIRPSDDIGRLALTHMKNLPLTLRHLLRGLGTAEESADLISYLLFDPQFTQKLIQMGRSDTLALASDLKNFLQSDR